MGSRTYRKERLLGLLPRMRGRGELAENNQVMACATYNGHSSPKLEKAVLDYLGGVLQLGVGEQHLAIGQPNFKGWVNPEDRYLMPRLESFRDSN